MQEDHVSMGWSAGRKLRRAVDALTQVLAIELLTAARGIELRAPLTPAPATNAVIEALRRHVAGAGPDRFLAPEIEAATHFVKAGEARRAAETVTGELT
jgi:histidine ammonia-lyase